MLSIQIVSRRRPVKCANYRLFGAPRGSHCVVRVCAAQRIQRLKELSFDFGEPQLFARTYLRKGVNGRMGEREMVEGEVPMLSDFEQSSPERGGTSFAWILAVVLIRRRFILAFALLGFLIALVAALLKASTYTASFSFIPQSGQDQSRSGLASLAGQFGISVGGSSQPPQLYADLLETREILAPIARDSFGVAPGGGRRVPLAEFFGVRGSDLRVVHEMTVRMLRTRVVAASAATRTTGVVDVTVKTKSPQVSFEIANRLLDGLNRFNLATRRSQAGEERRFTEGRLEAAKATLRSTEDALQYFLSGNRQLANSPQLSFRRDRLQREVSLQQQVVMGLAQQYEDARIREVRDTPVITLIDKPTLPAMADPRGRGVIIVLGTFVAFVLGVALVLTREGWNRRREEESGDPSYSRLANEWQRLGRRIRKS